MEIMSVRKRDARIQNGKKNIRFFIKMRSDSKIYIHMWITVRWRKLLINNRKIRCVMVLKTCCAVFIIIRGFMRYYSYHHHDESQAESLEVFNPFNHVSVTARKFVRAFFEYPHLSIYVLYIFWFFDGWVCNVCIVCCCSYLRFFA